MEIVTGAQGFVVGFLTTGRETMGADGSAGCGEVEVDNRLASILVMLHPWISSRSRKVQVRCRGMQNAYDAETKSVNG